MSEEVKPIKIAQVIDEDTVVINAGLNDGVRPGWKFLFYRHGAPVKDPDSGEDLGVLEIVVGRGEVTHVQARIATVTSIEQAKSPKRIVRDDPRSAYSSMNRLLRGAQVEEIEEAPIKLPFNDAKVGDIAKRI